MKAFEAWASQSWPLRVSLQAHSPYLPDPPYLPYLPHPPFTIAPSDSVYGGRQIPRSVTIAVT